MLALIQRVTEAAVTVGDRELASIGPGMLALVAVIVLSAVHRLAIYVDAYGLTRARVHGAAVLVWFVLTLLCFALTVLRGAIIARGVLKLPDCSPAPCFDVETE